MASRITPIAKAFRAKPPSGQLLRPRTLPDLVHGVPYSQPFDTMIPILHFSNCVATMIISAVVHSTQHLHYVGAAWQLANLRLMCIVAQGCDRGLPEHEHSNVSMHAKEHPTDTASGSGTEDQEEAREEPEEGSEERSEKEAEEGPEEEAEEGSEEEAEEGPGAEEDLDEAEFDFSAADTTESESGLSFDAFDSDSD